MSQKDHLHATYVPMKELKSVWKSMIVKNRVKIYLGVQKGRAQFIYQTVVDT